MSTLRSPAFMFEFFLIVQVRSWKHKLPLNTVLRVLQVLVPQVEKLCIDTSVMSSPLLSFPSFLLYPHFVSPTPILPHSHTHYLPSLVSALIPLLVPPFFPPIPIPPPSFLPSFPQSAPSFHLPHMYSSPSNAPHSFPPHFYHHPPTTH